MNDKTKQKVGILSPGSFDFSHDEGFDSEDDSDHYEDLDDSDSGKHLLLFLLLLSLLLLSTLRTSGSSFH